MGDAASGGGMQRPETLHPGRQSEPGDFLMCVVHGLIREEHKEMSGREGR